MLHLLRYGFFLLYFIPILLPAQDDWRSGYVVTNEGDTLQGMVRDRDTGSFGGLYRKIKWKANENTKGRKRGKFRPGQLTAYQWGDARFVVLPVATSSSLLYTQRWVDEAKGQPEVFRVIAEGPLCLYHDEFNDDESSFIDFVPFFKKEGESDLVRATQGIFGLKKKLLSKYFADRPDLVNGLQSGYLKTPMDVVRAYEEGE